MQELGTPHPDTRPHGNATFSVNASPPDVLIEPDYELDQSDSTFSGITPESTTGITLFARNPETLETTASESFEFTSLRSVYRQRSNDSGQSNPVLNNDSTAGKDRPI